MQRALVGWRWEADVIAQGGDHSFVLLNSRTGDWEYVMRSPDDDNELRVFRGTIGQDLVQLSDLRVSR